MKYIERELEKITTELRSTKSNERYCELYAAQQSLSWAIDPENYAAPSVTILDGKVQPPIADTQAGSADCLEVSCRPQS